MFTDVEPSARRWEGSATVGTADQNRETAADETRSPSFRGQLRRLLIAPSERIRGPAGACGNSRVMVTCPFQVLLPEGSMSWAQARALATGDKGPF